jgi:hypothetical protein
LQKVGEGDVQDRVYRKSPLSTSSCAREERGKIFIVIYWEGGRFSVIESLRRVDAGETLRAQDRVYEESWFSVSPLAVERRSTAPSSYGDGGQVFEE